MFMIIKCSRFVLLNIVIFIMIGSQVFAANLDEVLNKHQKALGEKEDILKIASVSGFATMEYMGVPAKFRAFVKYPDQYYFEYEIGPAVMIMGGDGVVNWTVDMNDVVQEISVEELKPIINELYLGSYSYLFDNRVAGSLEYRGDTAIETTNYHCLAMFPEGGDSLFVYVNESTGLIDYRIELISGMDMITLYGDYHEVAGVTTPFYVESYTVDNSITIISRVDSVFINANVPDSIFMKPDKEKPDYEFPTDMDYIEIPFYFNRGHIYLETYINGQGPFYFMLDSGAGSNVLSKQCADKLGIDISGALPARGIGGFNSIGFTEIDSMNIGGLGLKFNRFSVFEFDSMSGKLADIEGILGYDFFTRFPIKIDFGQELITIFHPDNDVFDFSGQAISMEVFYKVPVVEVALNGYPVRMAVDLGAQMGILIRENARNFSGLKKYFDESKASKTIYGIGGAETVKKARLDSLNIGVHSTKNPVVLVAETADVLPFPEYIEGLVGLEILKDYNLLIDYSSGKIYFEPRE